MRGSPSDVKADTWTSNLGVGEFEVLRTCGFEPVGQVMGCAVHSFDPSRQRYSCRDERLPVEYRPSNAATSGRPSVLTYSDAYLTGSAAAWRATLKRMAAECSALGGDGVVAVEVGMGPFPGTEDQLVLEAIGTAVRARGRARPGRPFLSHLGGQDFAKLVTSGWAPVDLLVSASVGVRHNDWRTARSARRFAGAREIDGWTELMSTTRRTAHARLREEAARTGADGVLVSRVDLRLHECECSYTPRPNHVVEMTMFGTAIAEFRTAHQPARPLTIMRFEET